MAEPMEMQTEEQTTPGYCIEIKVASDGSMTVGVESGEYEAAEEQGAAQAGTEKTPEGQPVKGIKEALAMVLDIYQNNGQMTDSGEAEFQAGFGKPAAGPEQLA